VCFFREGEARKVRPNLASKTSFGYVILPRGRSSLARVLAKEVPVVVVVVVVVEEEGCKQETKRGEAD
jgi:hypothetical protein